MYFFYNFRIIVLRRCTLLCIASLGEQSILSLAIGTTYEDANIYGAVEVILAAGGSTQTRDEVGRHCFIASSACCYCTSPLMLRVI